VDRYSSIHHCHLSEQRKQRTAPTHCTDARSTSSRSRLRYAHSKESIASKAYCEGCSCEMSVPPQKDDMITEACAYRLAFAFEKVSIWVLSITPHPCRLIFRVACLDLVEKRLINCPEEVFWSTGIHQRHCAASVLYREQSGRLIERG
jgi:hypothetical protein